MSFPTLSKNPYSIEEKFTNNTISKEFDGGYKQTRERHTRDLKTIKVVYQLLSRADKDLIEAHILSVRGSEAFIFTNADNGNTYTVRYTTYPAIKADAKVKNYFSVTLDLETV